jgi:hypothetical protein
MNPYCVDLNWNIPLLSPHVDINIFKKKYHTKGDITDIHPLMLQHLASKGMKISLLETFYSEPNYTQPIHIDVDGGDYSKLNWVFGGNNSLMHWYKLKNGVSEKLKITSIGTIYSNYDIDQVELVHSQTIGKPSLIQSGIPHNVTTSLEERLCICLVIINNNEDRIPMQKAIELLIE